MPSAKLFPFPRFKALDQNAGFLAGGKLFSYIAGTNSQKPTYTDQSGMVANQNPIILDGSGEADVWLALGAYKFILTDANDQVYWTVDNVESQPSDLTADTLDVGTINISGQLTSEVTGVAPFVIASTVKVPNLNADKLDDADWAAPGPIGGSNPNTGQFTALVGTSLAVGSGGSVIKGIQFVGGTRVPVDLGSISANSRGSVDVPIGGSTGIATGDILFTVDGPVALDPSGDLIYLGSTIIGTDLVRITVYNPTGSPIDPALVYFSFLWFDFT